MANIVFIATSLDGYIADKSGKIDWLYSIPNLDNVDTGFFALMERIDALVIGRKTLDVVLSFDCDWPYTKPVFVLSNTMTKVPQYYEEKVFLVKGELKDIIAELNAKGFHDLYIDGGVTIQNFINEDLIDQMIITRFPILLGGGVPLFGELKQAMNFKVTQNEILLDNLVKTTYLRER